MTYEDTRARLDSERTLIGRLHEEMPLIGPLFNDEWTERKHSLHEDRSQAQNAWTESMDAIEEQHESVASRIQQSIEQERPVRPAERDELVETTATIARSLGALNEELDEDYLRLQELLKLRRYMVQVGSQKRFIDAKVAFDEARETVSARLTEIEERLEPYRDYERYLLREDKNDLLRELQNLQDRLVRLKRNVDFDSLHETDGEIYEEVFGRLLDYQEHLCEYNEQYIESEASVHSDLFSNVADGYSFTNQQIRAIVTNERYNQVIAAAGAGKTDVLIYRIIYLLRKGVNADDIIALTYTTEAAKEMRTRLGELDINATKSISKPGVTIANYHSFGKQIVEAASRSALEPVDESELNNFIRDKVNQLTTRQTEFKSHFFEFLVHYEDEFLDETSFETKEQYLAARRTQEYRTIGEETVRTKAEKEIADFLFRNQVKYVYRQPIDWMEQGRDERRYKPAFYLPEVDVYIEHWELDENNETVPWANKPDHQYQHMVTWAQNQYEQSGTTLIETYEFEHDTTGDSFLTNLEDQLRVHSVELDPLTYEEFVNEAFEFGKHKSVILNQFKEFIENAKTFGVSSKDVPGRLTEANQRQYHFGHCGRILLEAYEAYLGRHEKAIDFADMIYTAADIVEEFSGEFQNKYEHLLVDEFQDTSHAVIKLLQGFQGEGRDTRLFAVGDDWQSIYSFQGASVDHFLYFEDFFGEPEITRLTKNFRCPETVLDAGTKLMRYQPQERQIEKSPDAESGRDTTPTVHSIPGGGDSYLTQLSTKAVNIVETHLENGSDPSDIMILSRDDKGAPYLRAVKDELQDREIPWQGKNNDDWYDPSGSQTMVDDERPDAVTAFSIHQSKGRQAKHLIYLHAATGRGGIPAEDKTSDVIKPVKDDDTVHRAEERRLFYVAITRCKNSLDIITQVGNESLFIKETEEFFDWDEPEIASLFKVPVGETIDIEGTISSLDSPWKKQEQRGRISIGDTEIDFVSWASQSPPKVEEGTRYRLENIEVDEYRGNRQLVIGGKSKLHPYSDTTAT